jgi:hypothetical protein
MLTDQLLEIPCEIQTSAADYLVHSGATQNAGPVRPDYHGATSSAPCLEIRKPT